MADTSGPWDGSPWAEAQWYASMGTAIPSGVIGTPAGSATTGALGFSNSGLSITLLAGSANVGGGLYERVAPLTAVQATANTHSTFSRRDRLVLRRDLATHAITPVVIAGTAASSPVAPAIVRSSTQHDLALFSFLVPPASGTNLSGITDERVWLDGDVNPRDLDLRLDTAEADIDALNTSVAGTAAGGTRVLKRHHGAGTVYPSSNLLVGDTFLRTDVNCVMRYAGGSAPTWRQAEGPVYLANASARPAATSSALYAGFQVYIASQAQVFTWDGSYWRNDAAGRHVPAGASSGDLIIGLYGTATVTTNASGVATVASGQTFATAPDYATATAGSQGASSNVRYVVPNASAHTASNLNVTAFGGSGATINNTEIRVNFHVIGYVD